MSCVNTKHKEFIQLSEKLNISEGNLELLIYEYQNTNSDNENKFPSEEYIKQRLTGTNPVTSKSQVSLWKKYYSKVLEFNNIEDFNNVYTETKKLFPSEAITTWETRDGKYVIKVAEPNNYKAELYKKELQNILDKAPRNNEGKLLAPNGKPSNLTERQYAQVRTKEFKEWFGDWINPYKEDIHIDLDIDRESPDADGFGTLIVIKYKNEYIGSIPIQQQIKNIKDFKFTKYIDINSVAGSSYIEEEFRGKGFGKAAYWELGMWLSRNGSILRSAKDISRTEAATRVWKSLERDNFAKKVEDRYEFVNNSSKVVDENGEPLVVYHGSPVTTIDKFDLEDSVGLQLRDIEEFTLSNTAWFTPEERIAKNTYSVIPESLGKESPEYGKVYPAFLNIKNPLRDGLKNAKEHLEWFGNYVTADEKVKDFISRVYQRANSEDIDGFVLTFEDRDQDAPLYTSLQTQYGITEENQIKSAEDNIGTFSKESGNIFLNKDTSTIYDLLQYLHTRLHYSTNKSGVTEVKRVIAKLHDVYYVSRSDSEKALEALEKYRESYLLPKGIFKIEPAGINKIISVNTEVLKDTIERNQNNQNFGDLFSSAEEALRVRNVLDFLSAKTGLKYATISESEALRILKKKKGSLNSTNAFIHNNTCYFIQGRKLNVDIASEEMLHPFINAMYNKNRMLFNNLLKEAMLKFPKLRLEIAESYKGESEDVRHQELVTQALSRAFREERKGNPEGRNLSDIIKYFLDFVKSLFSTNNKDYILVDELKSSITLEDLSKIINTELKLLYNSNFGEITRFNKKYDKNRSTYSGKILSLKPNQIFVFGSNPEGRHGAGAAKTAKDKFGANYGQGEGMQGQSYALPTKRIKNMSVSHKGQMSFSYGENKRKDVQSSTTFEAVINGERTATTRYASDGNIEYWKEVKVGDIVAFESKDKKGTVFVRITKPLTKLSKDTNAEEWSKKEGWSTEYYESKVKPKVLIGDAYQMEYEFVDANGERTVTPKEIKKNIKKLYDVARKNPNKEFLVAYSKDGKNLNGYTAEEMAEMFASEEIPINIIFEEEFYQLVKNKQEDSIINTEQLEVSKKLIDKIISDSKKNIKKHPNFDEEDKEGSHTYLIKHNNKWIPVDTSVTQLVHGKVDLGGWKLPSSRLGNTADRFSRSYFDLYNKELEGKGNRNTITRRFFPNMTKEHKQGLKEDLDKVVEHLNNKFGKGKWRAVTSEFPIAGKYTVEENGIPTIKTIAGTMDMLVYDDKGNFYIYDFKTVRSNLSKDKLQGYYMQLSVYKAILEANYPELRGKIKGMELVRFDLWYETPFEEGGSTIYQQADLEEGEDKDTLWIVLNKDGITYVPIEKTDWYSAPRIHSANEISTSFYPVEESKLKESFLSLSSEDKEIIPEAKEIIKKDKINTSERDSQVESLYNNPLLSASERLFLANTAMYYTSNIITHLQSNSQANEFYLGNKYRTVDFTKMSREEIIDIVGINTLLDYVKERYYNPKNRDDIEDWDILDKLELAYNNWEALTSSAYSKLITLEGVTVVRVAPEYIKREDLEEGLSEINDMGTLEESEREYWQLGQRHISAKASLSKEVRRIFERLLVRDFEGNEVRDKYGYGFNTFVDSGEAINKILDWCQECTTIEEMEGILTNMKESNPWVNSILEKIKDEPFRSQFYQNFRKDFTQYSIITVEYDSKGNRTYTTTIINTKGATKAVLEGVVNAYKEGLLTNIIVPIKGDLEGKGRLNIKEVAKIKASVDSITKNLHKSFGKKGLNSILVKEIPNIVKVLNSIGISINSQTLKDAFAKDTKVKNEINTNYFKVLSNITYLLDTLLTQKNNTEYSPIEKGGKGNVYSNYKNIVNTLSKYIQDSIESSTYENGKMHYSFVTPSYMGKLVTNLKDSLRDPNKFKSFMEENYKSYKWFYDGESWNNEWLRLLDESSEMRQTLEHKVQLSFDGTPYNELSELGYTLSLIHEYFYNNAGKKELAWYRLPILANKPSSEFLRFRRYSGQRYKASITRGLNKVFTQEIMRIRTVLERAINSDINKIGVKEKVTFDIKDSIMTPSLKSKIKNKSLTIKDLVKKGKLVFAGSGAEFKFLPALNEELINNTLLGRLIVDKLNGKAVNEETLEKEFNKAINTYMDRIVGQEILNWRSIGLFDKETDTTNVKGKKVQESKYKYISQLGKTEEEVLGALEEYIWNDMFATINIIQLTATDLAYYRNIEDFQKRYAQVHSPSMRLNISAKDNKGVLYSKDGMERTIYLKDFVLESEIIPQVTKVFEQKINSLSGADKEHMIMMKDLIISSFKDINVADAQGYSSPTSYRKKMGMQGRWTSEMEEAYERIKSGNFNVNDLGIVWQPLKPFVYSQIRKSSGAETMSELKVPVQNKNSEYLLILADAIMRGGNQVSKLTAIYDFMEDSAYDGRVSDNGKVIKKGTYNGIGIDTVQFESAVNSGSMGSIDINSLDSYDSIKQALYDAVYYNSDKSETIDNDMDRYNDQYVHAIPFEDYGIQQEVPAHLVDHEQPMGSQIRILSISDITPGTEFIINGEKLKDTKLVEEYQNLIAKNIKDSFEELLKDFKIKGTRLEKNRAISELLIDAIQKDQRYGADLLRACSLNSRGEFNVPLSDPIQSIRIQQLINSIIKSRINKQKIQGGPVVQTSVFGMSDDLHIVWNKDGSVKYFECYMPIPSGELEEALTKYDKNGNAYFMTIEEAVEKEIITEEMRKAIGYRIPTEDKYSMIPLRIKGFLPKAAGEAIMLPKEITKLAGSDFDIDKVYIMLKAFNVTKPKVNYKLVNDAFNTYLSKQGKSKEEIRSYIYGNPNTGEESIANYIKKIEAGVSFSTDASEEGIRIDEKGMQVSKWYKANKDKVTTKYSFVEETSLDTREGRNNRIFDLQWAVLTHLDTMDKMFNPGSFDVQKKSARIIQILKYSDKKYKYSALSKLSLEELEEKLEENNNNRNILLSSTQVYFHKQNMTAGKLIGIFANNNTSHAFLSLQDVHINIDTIFKFNGVTISNSSNNKLDSLRGKDGALISKTIAGFLAASVDAVKDPVLNFMNLNTFTAGTGMLLARLGFNSDSIGLFLTQPIIEQVTREYFKRSNEGYTTIDDVINDFLPNDQKAIDGIKDSLGTVDFTMEDLAKGISLGSSDTDFQRSVLVLFQILANKAQDLNTLTFLTKFNSISNAVGPTIADTLVMKERYEKFIDKMSSDNPPFTKSAKYVIENSPILEAFFDTTVSDSGASRLIFQDYFPHYSTAFSIILQKLRAVTKGNLDSRTINKLVNDFILYKFTIGEDPVLPSDEGTRKFYMLQFPKEFAKINSAIVEGNDLLKIINIKASTSKCPVPTLEAKTGGYNIDIQERVKAGWSNLVLDPKTRKLGESLLFYNIFRSGFNFSPKTFGNLASVDVKTSIAGYIDYLEDIEFNNSLVNVEEFLYQFLRNHTDSFKLVPEYKPNKRVEIDINKNIKGKNVITFTHDNKYSGMHSILIEKGEDPIYAKVIQHEGKLYMNPILGVNSVTYTETTPLGITNNFLEYDGNSSSDMPSVFKSMGKNRETSTITPISKEIIAEPDSSRKNYINARELDKELKENFGKEEYNLFDSLETQKEKEEFIESVIDLVLDSLNVTTSNSKLRNVVAKKVKERIKEFC